MLRIKLMIFRLGKPLPAERDMLKGFEMPFNSCTNGTNSLCQMFWIVLDFHASIFLWKVGIIFADI